MKLVIDSNIIVQDYHLSSSYFTILLESLGLIPAKLYVPEVVIDEVVNKYKETLLEKYYRMNGSIRDFNKISKKDVGVLDINVLELVELYKANLLDRLKQYNCEIMPYPDITLKVVVQRIFTKKKPFKKDESGYRDFLIWETVRKLVFYGSENVVFLTNNHRDFGSGPKLEDDLRKEVWNSHQFLIYNAVKKFNDDYVMDHLKALDGIKKQLQVDANNVFEIKNWLSQNLEKILKDFEIGDIVYDIPQYVGSFYVSDLTLIKSLDIYDVSELPDKKTLVIIRVKCDIEINLSFSWAEYNEYAEVKELVGISDEPFNYTDWSEIQEIDVGFNFILDKDKKTLIASDLNFIEGASSGILCEF